MSRRRAGGWSESVSGSTSWMRLAGISSSQRCLRFSGSRRPAAALRGVVPKARVVRGVTVWAIGRVRVARAGWTKTR